MEERNKERRKKRKVTKKVCRLRYVYDKKLNYQRDEIT